MKVLQVGKFYPPHPGGMETVLMNICQAIKDHVELRVLVANSQARTVREMVDGVDVLRAASWGMVAATSVCPTFPYYLKTIKADIVHLHELNPLATVAYQLVRPSGKLIVTFHSEWVRQRVLGRAYDPLQQRILRLADRIVVSSPPPIEHWPALAAVREKCVVVPFGIDVSYLQDARRSMAAAQAIRHQYGEPLLLFVGRVVYYKGLDVLLKAMHEIPARLLIVGDGPLRPQFEQVVQQDGLKTKVVWLGERPLEELAAFYRACDIFVLPSTHNSEAFGMVQIEAMACGKPVVSTNLLSGVPWVNQDGETGLVVPPNDVDALVRAIQTLLMDRSLRLRLGEGGRRRVAREFTRERMGERLLALYRSVLEAPPSQLNLS